MLPATARPAAFAWRGNVAPHGKNVLAEAAVAVAILG
jgi:hypothetical protein